MKGKRILGVVLILVIGMILGGFGRTAFSEPGSQDDPLVTMSYVDKRIEQLKYYIDEKIGQPNSSENGLEVVEVKEGQSIIGKAGTEIILRGGKAQVIAGELGGLCDMTAGVDLKMWKDVSANHLLLVPRDDGRGVYAIEDATFIVRGKYTLK